MNIRIVCVGRLKEQYWRGAEAEYLKRLSRYCKIAITELRDEPEQTDTTLVKRTEGARILNEIDAKDFVIALDMRGSQQSSEAFAGRLQQLMTEGKSSLVFIIGGSLGLDEAVLKRADYIMSFSQLTFAHQMMRVVLLEQVYRAFKIINNEVYHK